MTEAAPRVEVDHDLTLTARLIERTEARFNGSVAAPPLRLSQPVRLHTTLRWVDARARALEVVFKAQTVELWLSTGSQRTFLHQIYPREPSSAGLLEVLWDHITHHFTQAAL